MQSRNQHRTYPVAGKSLPIRDGSESRDTLGMLFADLAAEGNGFRVADTRTKWRLGSLELWAPWEFRTCRH
jgi:hypothetical protein